MPNIETSHPLSVCSPRAILVLGRKARLAGVSVTGTKLRSPADELFLVSKVHYRLISSVSSSLSMEQIWFDSVTGPDSPPQSTAANAQARGCLLNWIRQAQRAITLSSQDESFRKSWHMPLHLLRPQGIEIWPSILCRELSSLARRIVWKETIIKDGSMSSQATLHNTFLTSGPTRLPRTCPRG